MRSLAFSLEDRMSLDIRSSALVRRDVLLLQVVRLFEIGLPLAAVMSVYGLSPCFLSSKIHSLGTDPESLLEFEAISRAREVGYEQDLEL